MSTREATPRHKSLFVLLAAVGLVVIVSVGILLRDRVPGNMGNGFLAGAGMAIIAALIMAWRVSHASSGATTFERAYTSFGDERDDIILTRTLAVMGLLSLPLTGVAGVSIALGADVMIVLFLLMVCELLTGVAAFAVYTRKS